MKIDCRLYLSSLTAMKPTLIRKSNLVGPCRAANEASVYSHIPMIAVVKFLMLPENFGPREDLQKMLQSAIDFGTCDEVVPFD